MNDSEHRPSPDDLLKAIQDEEGRVGKGELKIFLGMAAGVGKTYAMLSEAKSLQQEGIDVVIGIVETHGRQETAILTKDLPRIPEKRIDYRGIELKELDVDEIIKRHPKVVLIDELAHSNIPGSKHSKRWQDVLDILDEGIDVYTTLNVQHIESLNDVISGITDIPIRETVPDSVIERASSIHLVDLTPKDLLERLKEGKVYLGNQSQIAIEHFFQKDTLTALREVVLRYAADKVDQDLRQMMTTDDRIVEWRPREKYLVGITSNPFSQKLLRITRRLAFNIDAPWIAVHVNNGAWMSDKETYLLEKNLAMARDLGAEVITVNDPDVAYGIERIAKQKGITQMIIGVNPPTSFLGYFKRATLFDKLLEVCPDVDIHIIKQEKTPRDDTGVLPHFSLKSLLPPYLLISLCVSLITVGNWIILPMVGYKLCGSLFLIAILGLSLFFKKGPIIMASLLFGLLWIVFFVPPAGEVAIHTPEDYILLFLFVITGLTSGILVDRAREHRELLTKSQETSQALYEIVRQIANAPSTDETLKYLREKLGKIIDGEYDFAIKDPKNGLTLKNTPFLKDDKELSTALWAYENDKEAGWGTDTLPSSQNMYLPLKAYHEIIGLLIYHPKSNKRMSLEDKTFLYTVCQQLANNIEKKFIREKSKQHDYYIRMEDIQKRIFEEFLEAFKSPISEMKTAINLLKEKVSGENKDLVTIETTCGMLSHIMENISAILKINEGMLPLKTEKTDMGGLIRECCQILQIPAHEHKLNIKIEKDIPDILCDEYLMEILIFNLILNALKSSPKGASIDIEAKIDHNKFLFSVTDQGSGFSKKQLSVLFQKYNRFVEELSSGMGFGLSISKTIAEIHNGTLTAENTVSGGGKFTLDLPV